MITYDMRDMGNESLYHYLYRRIRSDILEGRLKAGEKMPSKRAFARNQGVAVITVENTYAQLLAEGYLYALPRRGYFVSGVDGSFLLPWGENKGRAEESAKAEREAATTELQDISSKAEKNGAAADRQDIFAKAEKKGAAAALQDTKQYFHAGEYEIDLAQSRVSADTFPFNIWARLSREVLQTRREELLKPAPGAGIWPLRSAIAAYLFQYLNMKVSAEQIIIGAGTEYLYSLLIRLLGTDLVYAVEDPGYPKTGRIYESNQVPVHYIPMDLSGIRPDCLIASGADVSHISPSHQFPTGVTMPIMRRGELLAWCRESSGRYLIEDDYDSEFRLSGKLIPPIMSIDQTGRVIYMNTFTKSLASTIRISYMVLSPSLLQRYRERLGFYSSTVPNLEQYVLAAFIQRGYYEKHINRMRNYYRQKRKALMDALMSSAIWDKLKVSGTDTGLHFLLYVKSSRTEDELSVQAAAKGVRLYGLSRYMKTEERENEVFPQNDRSLWPEPCMVVNYQGLSYEEIEALPGRLQEAWFS